VSAFGLEPDDSSCSVRKLNLESIVQRVLLAANGPFMFAVRFFSTDYTFIFLTELLFFFLLYSTAAIIRNRNTTFRKLIMFPFSGEEGENIPTQLGPFERVNLNRPGIEINLFYGAQIGLRTRTGPVSKMSCFCIL
jgi:hypothetical protein